MSIKQGNGRDDGALRVEDVLRGGESDVDELDEAVALLKDAPGEFRKDAAKEIIRVVSDYENWLSHGKPPLEDWRAIRVLMNPRYEESSSLRKVAQRQLELNEQIRRRAREGE